MLRKRVIPCLDVAAGRVVKGVQFQSLRDMGNPVELAKKYELAGADEIVFLDITATHEGRESTYKIIQETAEVLSIPLCVGGGIRSSADMRKALLAGADKVAINSSAIQNPELIEECANQFGAQCVVVAIDAKRHEGSWKIATHGGRKLTQIDAIDWAKQAAQLGAGELLVTSMDQDGVQSGFDKELLRQISEAVRIPIIASGGAGNPDHMAEAILAGADAALAASIFHSGRFTVGEVKSAMAKQGIEVRL